ncbi:MAG: MFS transporter, partial [Chloroflexi bacterium]|nr:MFS transporter [Chloroflexota bacterium]
MPRGPSALRAFAYKGYGWFWIAGFCGFGSVQMQALARGYLARQLTPSPLLVTATFAAQALPLVVAPLIGGSLGDRIDRKRILVVAETAHLLQILAFSLLLVAGAVNIGVLLGFAIASGFTWSFGLPVRQAMIQDLVPQSSLANAVILFTGVFNAMLVLAPGLSGFIIKWASVEASFFTAMGLTAASLLFMFGVPGGMSIRSKKREPPLKMLLEGAKFIKSSANLTIVIIGLAAYTALAQAYYAILPVFQKDVLHVDAGGLGLMSTMVGVGSVSASLILVAATPRGPKPAMMVLMGLLQGIALVGFALSSNFGLSLGLLALVGMFQSGFLTLNTAMVQELTPREMGGRVMALRTVPWGLQPAGQVSLGSIAGATSPRTGLAIVATSSVAMQAVVLVWVRSMREAVRREVEAG